MIRPPKETEIPRLLELCAQHAAFEGAYFRLDGQEESLKKALFGAPAILHCLVLEVDEQIEGYATFLPQYATWEAAHYLYLDCLFLTEKMRRKGFGRQLMQAVKAGAIRLGCTEIQWQTPGDNRQAIAFYQTLGAKAKQKARFFWTV
ncbi:MAG: GNAT family N-acetyltransferase [Bacteroidota bacterium]